MSLLLNDLGIKTVTLNGTTLTKLNLNGTDIFIATQLLYDGITPSRFTIVKDAEVTKTDAGARVVLTIPHGGDILTYDVVVPSNYNLLDIVTVYDGTSTFGSHIYAIFCPKVDDQSQKYQCAQIKHTFATEDITTTFEDISDVYKDDNWVTSTTAIDANKNDDYDKSLTSNPISGKPVLLMQTSTSKLPVEGKTTTTSQWSKSDLTSKHLKSHRRFVYYEPSTQKIVSRSYLESCSVSYIESVSYDTPTSGEDTVNVVFTITTTTSSHTITDIATREYSLDTFDGTILLSQLENYSI